MKQLKIDGVHVLIEKDDSPSFMFTAVGWVDMIFGVFLFVWMCWSRDDTE